MSYVYYNSFNLHKIPICTSSIISPFYRGGKWSSAGWSDMPKSPELGSSRLGIVILQRLTSSLQAQVRFFQGPCMLNLTPFHSAPASPGSRHTVLPAAPSIHQPLPSVPAVPPAWLCAVGFLRSSKSWLSCHHLPERFLITQVKNCTQTPYWVSSVAKSQCASRYWYKRWTLWLPHTSRELHTHTILTLSLPPSLIYCSSKYISSSNTLLSFF